MADAPDNLVLEMLRRLDAKVDGLDAKVDGLSAEQRSHSRTLSILLQESRMLRSAVNDVARENVTPGEIEAVHEDLNKLRLEVDTLTTRLDTLEERQKDR